jgi:hypothetical protein
MTDQKKLTAGDVVKAIEARPNEFLILDFTKLRSAEKSTNKYMDQIIVLENGQKKKLGFSWNQLPLKGGIKIPSERKYDPFVLFRASSGDLGKATSAVCAEFKRLAEEGIKNKKITAKGAKAIIRSIIQTEIADGDALDDPIIRFKLPFKDGKPEFKLVRIEIGKDGNPKPVELKCTEENIHTLIKSRMVTSGYVSMDTVVFSGSGISIQARIQLLVIKPVENDTPAVESILSREEMLEMIGEPVDNTVTNNEDDTNDEENIDNTPAMGDQLEALRKLALTEELNDNEE